MKDLTSNSPFSPQSLLPQLASFAEKIEALCNLIGLDAHRLEMDHIAMRINESDAANMAHLQWSQYGQVISQAEINGRPIIVIELDKPVSVGAWHTRCIELPYPAKGKVYPEQGWEHAEFVVPYCMEKCGEDSFEKQVRLTFPSLENNLPKLERLGVKVKISSPKAEGERLPNPTIAFKWSQICVKLHPHALKDVINSERA